MKKLLVGAIAAGLTAAIVFVGNNVSVDPQIVAGVVAAIAWLAAWVNGRNNVV